MRGESGASYEKPQIASGIEGKKISVNFKDELVARSLELSKYKNVKVFGDKVKNLATVR